ncbi:hypothetical protein NPIL_388401 [Nephila pilipes]|uniref:Uncharacterized protein n=1 Tax=Nephila pilipes TaxID=299642 RepID=A0A8X6NTC6_NEPPI|nr:hypothetical protein NPIL_388401 [Nephila pilipes]
MKLIPLDWKISSIILIYKTGNIQNWRSIALPGTIYKLFTKWFTNGFSKWDEDTQSLSHTQKSSSHATVSSKTTFLLPSALTALRETKKMPSYVIVSLQCL